MRLRYILGIAASMAILSPVMAQTNELDEPMASAKDTVKTSSETFDEGVITIFSTPASASAKNGCSLIQNKWRDRKVYNLKHGYKIETANNDEIITVKHLKGGGKKISYYNDYETLDYHLKKNGKLHYSYSYINGCKKVKLNRDKNGITTLKNKSGMDMKEVRNNVRNAISVGVQSCGAQ